MASNNFGQQLGQLAPADTNAASLYAPPSAYRVLITQITICNTTGTAADYSIFHDETGTTYDATTALTFAESLAANTSIYLVGLEIWLDGANAGNIGVQSGTNDALTFTCYGARFPNYAG